MSVIKSFSVGLGDMFYLKHDNDNFSIIDCDLSNENADRIIQELKTAKANKKISRFICTHPDDDHFGGIELLDDAIPIVNFYVVKNQAIKDSDSDSFNRYCKLRDSDRAFYIEKGSKRKWMNIGDDERGMSGISILWPDLSNEHFKKALASCDAGESFNNTSAVIRYQIGNTSFLWLGDLETDFMEKIVGSIELKKTTIVFASHHGRTSGKIPNSWLEKLDPQVIVIGEAPSRHLHYYTGYQTITQNSAGDITMDSDGKKVHFYVSNESFKWPELEQYGQSKFSNYIGSITAETEYTLQTR
ncbi:ComEC/Rec2 family competence protein [Polaromonas sp. A23]|uniref:ComEC/Rec2 family competence protein n=1 Tax=Polaromonas sp. A23 TaxID=1944133 RepID=UPI000984F9C9|nr:MBL fold metallo-hydrolase [Polaromonas sp. A23]OOG37218.1 hypothetical protein B0B52_18890 [Polaromonas sp. A23]